MAALGCRSFSFWDGLDWDDCFRDRVLNTLLPLLLISASSFSFILHSFRSSSRKARTAESVAKLDPSASSFTIPQTGTQVNGHSSVQSNLSLPSRTQSSLLVKILSSILPWNSSRIFTSRSRSVSLSSRSGILANSSSSTDSSEAALEVFRTENAVILNEVHLTPIDKTSEQEKAKFRSLELVKRLIEVAGSVLLATSHATAWAMHARNWSWDVSWGALWIYFAVLSSYTLASKHSLFTHKAFMLISYFILSMFNLRTSLLEFFRARSPISEELLILASVQAGLAIVTLIPTLFFPLQSRLPIELRAIYSTINPQTQHGEARTAFPSPNLHPTDQDEACQRDGIHSEMQEKEEADSAPLLPPEDKASLFSRAIFGFVTPAIVKHYKVQFTLPAIPDLPAGDKAAAVVAAFRARSSKRHAAASSGEVMDSGKLLPSSAPLWRRLVRHFLGLLLLQMLWAAAEATLVLSPAFFLNKILAYIAERGERIKNGTLDEGPPVHIAVLYAFGMLSGQILTSISASQALFIGRRICIRLRAILITEIVTKSLRRKDSGGAKDKKLEGGEEEEGAEDHDADDDNDKKQGGEKGDDVRATDGQVVNLISVDVFKVSEICAYLHYLFPKTPITITLCVVYLVSLLGWSAVLGFAIFIISVPLQVFASSWFVKLQKQLLETTDQRLNLATEVLSCIKTVKFFAWERSFNERMDATRQKELKVLSYRFMAWLLNTFTYMGTPMLVTCVTFGAHTKIFKQTLTAETTFTALALFNTLRNPLDALPDMVVQTLNSLVSVRRIDKYLREEETMKYNQLLTNDEDRLPNDPVVGFQDASFCYSESDEEIEAGAFCLRDINLTFPVGELSIIAGPVGSGKTSLLLSFLGETRQLSGRTFMPCPVARALAPVDPATGLSESVSYCSQSPWLLGTTLKENILFGSKWDERRYRACIKACALEPDLKILEYGDETEVGEKGTSLSGGQKARIALARAFYSSAKHILIDDALSAVDAHTAKHLFQHCLKGSLAKGRTILLVTHAISLCLPGAAFAVAMDDGRVVAAGTPAAVSATGVFGDEGLSTNGDGGSETEDRGDLTFEHLAEGGQEAVDRAEMQKRLEKKKAHANEETYASGSIGAKTYGLYLGSVARKKLAVVLCWFSLVLIFVSVRAIDISSGAWLMKWAGAHDYKEKLAANDATSAFSMASAQQVAQPLYVAPQWNDFQTMRPSFNLGYLGGLVNVSSSSFSSFLSPSTTTRGEPEGILLASATSPQLVMSAASLGASRQPEKSAEDLDTYYLYVYFAITVAFVFLAVFRDAYEFFMSLRASRIIYRKLINAILNAKPSFFDKTPIGRIMNRLSKDIETIDQEMAVSILFLMDCVLSCTAILLLICYTTPLFAFVAIVIMAIYYVIGTLYIVSSRDLKRVESVQRSPIYTVVGEVLQGAVTIRAYGDAGRFTRHCLRLVDKANRAFFFLWYENRWLSIRVDVAGAFVAFIASLFLLSRPDIEASLAGFTLAYAITFVDSVLWIVRMYTMVEINMNSVERIGEYLDLESEKQDGVEPPAYWPSSEGSIVVENLSVRYTAEFPRVLSGVNLEIKPREKVGIVGRTGSGKSTLALCFFRFLEAEEGAIYIDGIDISTVPLKTLRQKLTVIPQDAQLFSGTVRSNLDPFNTFEDAELWMALQRCRLASTETPAVSRAVSRAPSRPGSPGLSSDPVRGEGEEEQIDVSARTNVITSLDDPVLQGGKNLSAGQRQLLALARGLLKLRDSKILLLDESTANLDSASDAMIQKTIRSEMAPQATIITIAHRIKTIVDYDKICVLDKGKVVEFGSPKQLIDTEGGIFRSLCEQSGEMTELYRMAEQAEEERSKADGKSPK
ncbi:putative YBT1 [Violaceomyces palustris]|uniref:YBT1 n=1 Tax=Violaceomyces palustris TaxID=1673888 RepID=A0ACD0NPT7_9BASI|nr:putative YBT1 [Violaceomyces palustris]